MFRSLGCGHSTERYNGAMTIPLLEDGRAAAGDIRLNEAQRLAVQHREGPLIVLAGPGTGKTHVITHRVHRLINEDGAEPESILALTFTNKAAEEMRSRLSAMLGSATLAERLIASTFHSFGLRLIRQFADRAGLRAEPDLIDEAQQKALMRRVVDETGLGREKWFYDPYSIVPVALRFVSEARNHACFPAAALDYAQQWRLRTESNAQALEGDDLLAEKSRTERFAILARLYAEYDRLCRQRGVVTYDDLQILPLHLLREHESLRAIVRSDHRHVIVDEFQDVNPAQIELLKCLAGPGHDLCVVGDDDQAIYAFRGAMQSSFHRFAEHWTNTTTIPLTLNYRSTPIILAAAHRIIRSCGDRFAPDKTTTAAGDQQDLRLPVELVKYRGTAGAGPVIGRMILTAVEGGANYRDFAVIVRSNADLDRIAASLQVMEIPVEIPERGFACEHPAVLDVLAWMRLLADEHENTALTRILIRPPFSIPLTTVAAWHSAHRRAAARAQQAEDDQGASRSLLQRLVEQPPSAEVERFARQYLRLAHVALDQPADVVVRAIIHATGLLTIDPVDSIEHRARVEQLGRWLAFVAERLSHIDPPRRLGSFLCYFDDLSDGALSRIPASSESRLSGEVEVSDRDAVRILTAHRAKGLEFDTVFIPRVNSPHGYPLMDRDRGEEDLLPDDLTRGRTSTHEDDERRVFFVAMTRARRRLVLLSQTMSDSGRKASPSVYWKEIEAPGEDGAAVDVIDAVGTGDIPDEPVLTPAPGEAAGRRSARDRRTLRLRHEVFALLHELSDPQTPVPRLAELRRRLGAAASQLPLLFAESPARVSEIIAAAESDDRPALRDLAEEMDRQAPLVPLIAGPAPPLELNFTGIDLYLRCPRCYWLRYVVGVPEPARPATNFGQIIHRSLEFFYERFQRAEANPGFEPPPTLEDLLLLGRRAYEEMRPPEVLPSREVARRIDSALRQYYNSMHSDQLQVLHIEQRVRFPYRRGQAEHFMTAKMDRIDQGEHGVRIVDYKTGEPTKSRLEPKKDDLQLGIYIMAARHFFENDAVAGTAEYWLTRTSERGVLAFDDARLDKVRARIDEAIDGILDGRWERTGDCTRCDELLTGADHAPDPPDEAPGIERR